MSSPSIFSAALAAALALGGCGAQRVLATYPVPESAALDAAPWPRLVDTPDPASLPAPDPAAGTAIVETLGVEAGVAAAESQRLAGPVVDAAALRAEALAARRAAEEAAAPEFDPAALSAEAAGIRAAAEAAASQ